MKKIIYLLSALIIIISLYYILLSPHHIIGGDIKEGVNRKWLEEEDYSLLGSEKFYENLSKYERWRLKHIFDFYNVDYRVDENGNFYYKGDLGKELNIKFETKIPSMKNDEKMESESEVSYKVNNNLRIFTMLNCSFDYESCIFRLKNEDWKKSNEERIIDLAKPILGEINYRFGTLSPIKNK